MIKSFSIHHTSGSEPYGYIDIDIYIVLDTEEEWNLRVYKELETGEIIEADARYAENADACFDDAASDIPQEVQDIITHNMAEILVKIGRAQAEYGLKQNHSSPT